MKKEILIQSLGLTDKEASVYLAVLELGSSTVQPIATRAGLKRTSIYYFIDHLVELGLIEHVKIRGKMYYKALSPKKLLTLQESRLDIIRDALPEFMSTFNASAQKPKISYFEGVSQIQNIMMEETRCKQKACYIWPGTDVISMIGGNVFIEKVDRMRKENGVWIDVIHFRGKETKFIGSAPGKKEMRTARYAPAGTTFPLVMGLYDTGKVGFFTTQKEGFGILIESTEMFVAMKFLFDMFWSQSKPIKESEW